MTATNELQELSERVLKALCCAEDGTMTVGEIATQLKLSGIATRRAIERLRERSLRRLGLP